MYKKLLVGFEILFGIFVVAVTAYFLGNWLMNKIVHSKNEVLVPDIQGRPVVQAFDMLAQKDLSMKKIGEEFTRVLPANTVIRQTPQPGAVVRKDRSVKVIVSMGSELKMTPELVGKSLRDAEIELRRFNLTLGEVSKVYSLKFKKDEVVSQDPVSGAVVEKDAIVNIVASDGRPPEGMILMPDFGGAHIDDAKKWAEQNEIEITSVIEEQDSLAPAGTILRQEPDFDREIFEGTNIRFVVSSGDEAESEAEETIFEYSVPQGTSASEVRIVLKERKTEKLLFKGKQNPGTKIRIPHSGAPGSKIRVFVNDILVDERTIPASR